MLLVSLTENPTNRKQTNDFSFHFTSDKVLRNTINNKLLCTKNEVCRIIIINFSTYFHSEDRTEYHQLLFLPNWVKMVYSLAPEISTFFYINKIMGDVQFIQSCQRYEVFDSYTTPNIRLMTTLLGKIFLNWNLTLLVMSCQ